MLLVVTVADGQIIAAVIAIYGVAVAFTGKVIMHLVDKNTRLETKVDNLHSEMNKLHLEVRDLAKNAFEVLNALTDEKKGP